MENAVKALIMVAGLIVGVLVIGLLVYLFRLGGNVASNYDQSMSEGQIASFNAKFDPYITTLIVNDDTSTTAYKNRILQQSNNINDIVSIINLAYDINAKLNSDNIEDGIAIIVDIDSTKYYMNAKVLSSYYEKTLTNKTRRKNIVFNVENEFQNDSNLVELNQLIRDNSNSKLYTDGPFPERIYEYYFDCIDVNYTAKGRINKMEFRKIDMPNFY